jgi:two-component system CheB/CheR fusion protein
LVLDWIEEGIESRIGPQGGFDRRGYGRELIERALPYALKALTRYELGETELRCRIELPLSQPV